MVNFTLRPPYAPEMNPVTTEGRCMGARAGLNGSEGKALCCHCWGWITGPSELHRVAIPTTLMEM